MSVVDPATVFEFRYSGSADNNNPVLSRGGAISSKAIIQEQFNSIFDDVSGLEMIQGSRDDRIVYIRNKSLVTYNNVKVYFATPHLYITMALSQKAINQLALEEDLIESPNSYFPYEISVLPPTILALTIGIDGVNGGVGAVINRFDCPFYNQMIMEVDVWVRKVGTPPQPMNLNIKDRNGANKVFIGCVGAAGVTTSFTKITFKAAFVDYIPDVFDVIAIEAEGTTNTNKYEFQYFGTESKIGTTLTKYVKTAAAWQIVDNADLCMNVRVKSLVCHQTSLNTTVDAIFQKPQDEETALLIGTMASGDFKGLHLRRLTPPELTSKEEKAPLALTVVGEEV